MQDRASSWRVDKPRAGRLKYAATTEHRAPASRRGLRFARGTSETAARHRDPISGSERASRPGDLPEPRRGTRTHRHRHPADSGPSAGMNRGRAIQACEARQWKAATVRNGSRERSDATIRSASSARSMEAASAGCLRACRRCSTRRAARRLARAESFGIRSSVRRTPRRGLAEDSRDALRAARARRGGTSSPRAQPH